MKFLFFLFLLVAVVAIDFDQYNSNPNFDSNTKKETTTTTETTPVTTMKMAKTTTATTTTKPTTTMTTTIVTIENPNTNFTESATIKPAMTTQKPITLDSGHISILLDKIHEMIDRRFDEWMKTQLTTTRTRTTTISAPHILIFG